MAEYRSEDDCVARQQVYPNLEADLWSDFQRRRVASSAAFVQSGDCILDVGCNSGYFVDLCPPSVEVHGVDVNPHLVEIAKRRLASARVARAEALPFPDRAFDVVNVSGVLEQCFSPAVVLREATRVARRSVTGNTVYECGIWGRHRIPDHPWQARAFSESELRTLLAEFGVIANFGTIEWNGQIQCFFFEVRV